MVSFRYHLVSVGAVLLALAAGVVLGAGPLATKVATALAPAKPADTATAAAAVSALKARAAAGDAFIAATTKSLVSGELHKTRVVLVLAPGTPASLVAAVTGMLVAAGATVTGSVSLTPAWSDPAQATVLDGIATQLAPASTASTGTGSNGGTAQAAAALSAALLTRQSSALGQTSDPATALLAGLTQGGFLTRTGQPDKAASLAVLLAPATVPNAAGLLPLMTALRAAGRGVVVAGATGSATAGGVLATLRGDSTAKAQVSGVDSADVVTGRIALVLALAQQKAGGHGQYGSGAGADAPVPKQ
jgi:Copper transport outer membrane protein, MctB